MNAGHDHWDFAWAVCPQPHCHLCTRVWLGIKITLLPVFAASLTSPSSRRFAVDRFCPRLRHCGLGVAHCQCFSPGGKKRHPPGRNCLIGPPSGLSPAQTRQDDQRLAQRMGMPRGACSGLEGELPPFSVPVSYLKHRLHANRTGEYASATGRRARPHFVLNPVLSPPVSSVIARILRDPALTLPTIPSAATPAVSAREHEHADTPIAIPPSLNYFWSAARRRYRPPTRLQCRLFRLGAIIRMTYE